MEYTQWELYKYNTSKNRSLNPCCNGIYSMSGKKRSYWTIVEVLILVVMEYTQWEI